MGRTGVRSSRQRLAALLCGGILVAAGCGSRANDAQVAEALGGGGGVIGGRTVVGSNNPGGVQGPSGGDVAGPVASDGGSGPVGTTPDGVPVGNGPQTPGEGPATTLPATGNGGATDVGVTATDIRIANVAIQTGPVPGLFSGAAFGVDAFLAYINSTGGIYGRQLKLAQLDDQFDCSKNKSKTDEYRNKAFAFVGSFSLYDNCGDDVFRAHPEVPDIHVGLSQQAQTNPNNFSPQPIRSGASSGPFQYFKSQSPSAVKSCGSLIGDVESAKASWVGIKSAAVQSGYKFTYERLYAATETDFTADIVQMKTNGVTCLVLAAADSKTMGRIMKTAASQNFKPALTILGASGYDGQTIPLATKAAAEGAYIYLPTAMYLGEDSGTVPEVALLLNWLKRTHPSARPDLFTVYGWTSARLFVDALRKAGPQAKRATLIDQLRKIDLFDSNGLLAPAGPASKRPPTCYVIGQIHNGQFQRKDTPAAKYRCDGTYLFAR